jgi:hypothetical protein
MKSAAKRAEVEKLSANSGQPESVLALLNFCQVVRGISVG